MQNLHTSVGATQHTFSLFAVFVLFLSISLAVFAFAYQSGTGNTCQHRTSKQEVITAAAGL